MTVRFGRLLYLLRPGTETPFLTFSTTVYRDFGRSCVALEALDPPY